MSSDRHTDNKLALAPLFNAQYDFTADSVQQALAAAFAADARVRLAYPFEDLDGPAGLYQQAYAPLFAAIPDLERRDTIIIAGPTDHGDDWVGTCGYYTGSFESAWLDIPATGHQVSMRYHEFYRLVDDVQLQVKRMVMVN